MHVQTSLNRSFAFLASLVLAVVLCPAFQAPAAAQYKVTDLVSNGTGAPNHDPNLVNAWGITNFPGSPFWVSDNGTGKSTLYNGAGTPIPLVVTVPPASGTGTGSPTGIVANTDTSPTDFVISGKPAAFIFATFDGTISGWNGNTDTEAVIKVNRHKLHSSYTGLAMGFNNGAYFLYAADNGVNSRVDMFDATFKFVMSFTDPGTKLAPFNVQNINGYLYVTYGAIGSPGGLLDIFNTDGHLVRRFATNGKLNGPWGLALAPPNFGKFSSALLVGNLNDGNINAYDYRTHAFLGQLSDASGPIFIDGLWGLTFGSGGAKDANGQTNWLFFSAGPHEYEDGLFGVIVAK
jgi:uncharacterized protein (TIGR03118 family)